MKPNDFIRMCEDAIEKVCLQGVASVGDNGGCAYLSKLGCCVVGHMMPDNETRKKADSLKDSGVQNVIQEGVWGEGMFTRQQEDILLSLQLVHDSFEDCLSERPSKIDVEYFEERCLTILSQYSESLQ
jgi:hypothetical protein